MIKFGLENKTVDKLVAVISKSDVVIKAVIFGSRARGDYKYNSDIDIAVYTDGEPYPGFSRDVDEAAGIYKTNIIIMEKLSNTKLRQNIERDGVEIYKRDKELN